MLEKIQDIAAVKAQRDLQGDWFKGAETYLEALAEEILEVKEEIRANRRCYLEDELGDLLWNIACTLEHLTLSGQIDKNRVFERSIKKYTERVTKRGERETWESVKEKQKIELEREYLQENELERN
ncbi:MazG nucleotide pyrophosphohydrolase domain-containing protein [Vibrio mediterranei]